MKISRNPPDRSSGRLRPARAGSGQLGPAWADSGQLVFIKKSTAAGKRFLGHKNRPCKRHPILEDPSSLIAKHQKSLRFLKSPHPNDIFECGILEPPTRVGPGNEASPVAALDSPGYLLVAKAIESSFPEALVVPGLVVGATDTRHYVGLADASLRFGPMRLGPKDLSRIHGTNERIAVTNLTEMVRFYRQLILDADVLPASN